MRGHTVCATKELINSGFSAMSCRHQRREAQGREALHCHCRLQTYNNFTLRPCVQAQEAQEYESLYSPYLFLS